MQISLKEPRRGIGTLWPPCVAAIVAIAVLLWAGAHSSFTKYPLCGVSVLLPADGFAVGFDDAGRAMGASLLWYSQATLRCKRPGGGDSEWVTVAIGTPLDYVREQLGPPDSETRVPVIAGATVAGGSTFLTWGPPEDRLTVQTDGVAVTSADCTTPFEASNGAHSGGSLRDDGGMRTHEGTITSYPRQRALVTAYLRWPRGTLIGLLEAGATGCLLGAMVCVLLPGPVGPGRRVHLAGIAAALGTFAVHLGSRMAVDARPVTAWGYWDSGLGLTMLGALLGAGLVLATNVVPGRRSALRTVGLSIVGALVGGLVVLAWRPLVASNGLIGGELHVIRGTIPALALLGVAAGLTSASLRRCAPTQGERVDRGGEV